MSRLLLETAPTPMHTALLCLLLLTGGQRWGRLPRAG